MLEGLRRALNTVLPLGLAVVLVLPAIRLPANSALAPAQTRLVDALRAISVQQSWRMYAPNPARGYTVPYAVAVAVDGSERELEESHRSALERGRVWFWTRRRVDFWRFQVAGHRIDRPSRNRSWYLRGVCVREARRGEVPRFVRLYGERVRMRPPDAVREGKAPLTRPRRKLIETVACRTGHPARMIEEDRGVGRR